MTEKLTITVSDEVYKGLYDKIGPGKISGFIDSIVRAHVLEDKIDQGYAAMAADQAREDEAQDWGESLINAEPRDEAW